MSALREVFARFSTEFDGGALERGEGQVGNMTQSLQRLGAAIVGAVGIQAMRGFVESTRAVGDELDKTSRVIGISIEDLQSWRHAADLSGVGASSFNSGLTRLQRNMFDAQRGVETAAIGFRTLGVSFEDSEGQLRPVQDVLRDMADPLNNLTSDSERVAILMTLMGRSGARMGPLFDQGAEGIDAMRGELEALGGGASQEMIQAAADLTDANARLDLAFLSLKSRLAVHVLPAVQRGVEWMTRFSQQTNKLKAVLSVLLIPVLVLAAKRMVAMGLAGAAANAQILAGFILWAAAAVLAYAILEDIFTALDGGKSLTGDFTNAIYDFIGANEGMSWVADIWRELLDAMTAVYEFTGVEALFGLDAPDAPESRTNQRGLVAPSQGFRTNEAADASIAQQVAREDAVYGGVSGIANRQRRRAAGAAERIRGGAQAFGAPDRSEFTSRRGLPPPPAAAPVINQEIRIEANGLDEAAVARVTRREMDRSNREILDSLATGVAAGDGI